MAGDEATREVSRRPLGTVRRLSIAVARGVDAGRLIEPEAGAGASVGTAPDNDLVLTDPTVSRYHLELEPGPDGISVRDLGSRNGSFAGAVRIREGIVPRGAQLKVGDTVLVLDAANAAAPPEAAAPELPGMVFASASMQVRIGSKTASRRLGGAIDDAPGRGADAETGMLDENREAGLDAAS